MVSSLDMFFGEKNLTFLTIQLAFSGWFLISQARALDFITNLNRKLETRKIDILYSGISTHFTVLSPVLIRFMIK